MSVITRKGDSGTTSTLNKKGVKKNNPIIHLLGEIDELNSHIGLLASFVKEEDKKTVQTIQKNLYAFMAFVSGSPLPFVVSQKTKLLEEEVYLVEKKLPQLHGFIVPGGTPHSSYCHVVRSVCRRVERVLVSCSSKKNDAGLFSLIPYFNRLSDYFFVLARKLNTNKEILL